MKKLLLLSAVLFGTVAASQAGGVHFGFNLPLPPIPLPGRVIISQPAPVYVEPYCEPAPVYVEPYCAPAPRYYVPQRRYYSYPSYRGGHSGWGHYDGHSSHDSHDSHGSHGHSGHR